LLFGIVLIVLSFVNDSGLYHSVVLPFQIIKGLQIAGFMAIGFVTRKALFSMRRTQAALTAFGLIIVYIVSAVAIVDIGFPSETLWILRMVAAVSGVIGFTALCIIIKNNSVLARVGRDSLVFYAVNALSLNVAKLGMFRSLKIDATHWVFGSQLLMGLITTVLAMAVMFAIDVFVQKCLWWSIGKPRPVAQLNHGMKVNEYC
jgi:hypothetical protein